MIFKKTGFQFFLIQDYRLEKFYWISNMCSTAKATPELQGFFLWRIFATWRQRKRARESNKGIFENFFKNFAISPEKKS